MENCPHHDRIEMILQDHTKFVGRASSQLDDLCEIVKRNEKTLCEVKMDVAELKVIAKENRTDIDRILGKINGNGSIPKVLNEPKDDKTEGVKGFAGSLNKAWNTLRDNIALVLIVIAIWAFLKVAFFKESIKIFGWIIGG